MPTQAPAVALGDATTAAVEPGRWLYVSRKLDVLDVPNEPPWRVPAFTHGEPPTPFYRLTAQVVVWLDACGGHLERQAVTAEGDEGKAARSQLDQYLALMEPIWLFSSLHLDRDEVRRARAEPPSLPMIVEDGPKWGELVPALGFFPRDTVEAEGGKGGKGKRPKRVA